MKEFQRAKQEALSRNGSAAPSAQTVHNVTVPGDRSFSGAAPAVQPANIASFDPVPFDQNNFNSGAPFAAYSQNSTYANPTISTSGYVNNAEATIQQQTAHSFFNSTGSQPYAVDHQQNYTGSVLPIVSANVQGTAQNLVGAQGFVNSAVQRPAHGVSPIPIPVSVSAPLNQYGYGNMVAPVDNAAEKRIQNMAILLQEEQQRNHELSAKVAQQQSVIQSLQTNLNQTSQHDTRASSEVDRLKNELASHSKTISILVAERGEQQAKIAQFQQEAMASVGTIEELQGRLNASRYRVTELEKELSSLESSQKKFDQSRQSLCTELENAQEENKRLLKISQDANDETTNVQHQLTVKSKEVDGLKVDVNQKTSEIELLKLRVEQLTSGDVIVANDSILFGQEHKLAMEKQITELQNTVSALSGEGERIEQQYQTYMQHLTKESTALRYRVEELVETNERAAKREEGLLTHIRDLERQIQKQISTQQKLSQQRDEVRLDESGGARVSGAVDESKQVLLEKLAHLEAQIVDQVVSILTTWHFKGEKALHSFFFTFLHPYLTSVII